MSKLDILSVSETELFLESLKSPRNYCICCFMVYAGLRVSEVVQLLISDIHNPDFPITTLLIRKETAKNKHQRLIPINKPLARAIEQYKRQTIKREWYIGENFLFPSQYTDNHITVRQVQRIVEHHSKISIGRKIHPHILRHTFATRLMRVTNIRVVQELLGHKNLSSTQIYTHPNSDDLKLAVGAII